MGSGRTWVLGAVFCSSVLLGCQGCGKKQETAAPEVFRLPVLAMKVVAGDIEDVIEYAGSIKAEKEATVYPRVGGKIIEKSRREGDRVAKGEAIAYVDRDEVGLKFEKSPVDSPIDGVVGSVYVDVGSSVTPQTPVALVVCGEQVKVNVYVPEKYLPRIRPGRPARVFSDVYPNREFEGRIARVSPVLNQDNRAFMVEISVDNASRELKSGMFVRAHIPLERKQGVPLILKEAVQGRDEDTYVFVVDNGTARVRKVRLGLRSGAYYEAAEGLSPGESVVIMGQQRLRDGMAVSVEEKK